MTNIEKLRTMRAAASKGDDYAPKLQELGFTEEQIVLALEGYDEGVRLFDAAIDAYELMHKLGRFEQLRRDGRPMIAQEREEKASLQRKVDDFAVKLFQAG